MYNVCKRQKKTEVMKRAFIVALDGVRGSGYAFPAKFDEINTFEIGVCKLVVKKDILHVYLRKPELLIGYHGLLIDKISKYLGYKIEVHQVNLMTF